MAVREMSQTFPDQNPRGSHRELNRAELIVERKKISRQEINRIAQDLERTYFEC